MDHSLFCSTDLESSVFAESAFTTWNVFSAGNSVVFSVQSFQATGLESLGFTVQLMLVYRSIILTAGRSISTSSSCIFTICCGWGQQVLSLLFVVVILDQQVLSLLFVVVVLGQQVFTVCSAYFRSAGLVFTVCCDYFRSVGICLYCFSAYFRSAGLVFTVCGSCFRSTGLYCL